MIFMEEKENEAMMHVINFDAFMKLTTKATLIDLLNTYQLPDLADKLIEKDESDFIYMLAGYHNSADDSWRIKKDKLVKIERSSKADGDSDDNFTFGGRKVFDAKMIYVVPKFNSIFLVPGERSIREGGCTPVEVYQFTNLISTCPTLIRIKNVEAPDGNIGLSLNYEIIDRQKNGG